MARSQRGLRLRVSASALNERALRLIGGSVPALTSGWMPWLQLHRYEPPPLPDNGWVRLRPILSGICGTDLGLLTGHASSILSPFASFPAVLGHEVVAAVEETGERVVLDPVISCAMRGLEPCRWCAAGQARFCLRATEGAISPGLLVGFCADLPGGWSDGMIAHRSQLHPVPEPLSDEAAVMVEPLSVALHAVLAGPPVDGEPVLVMGGGTLGLCTVAALRLTVPASGVVLVARHAAQRHMGERLGASVAESSMKAAVDHVGARAHRSLLGETVLSGGFGHVYDAVGSQTSLAHAMAVTGPGGRLVLVGGPAHIGRLDWTLAWTRELRIEGTYTYGAEPSKPGSPHTMDIALQLLAAHPEMPLEKLVTHRFRLDEWPRAMGTALGRRRSGAIKVVFES